MDEYPGRSDPAAAPALVLAYLGDAVYELEVRKYLISCGYTKVDKLHKLAVSFVNASTQARILHAISGSLCEAEEGVIRRGRNAKSGSVPKNISMSDYRHGTAFESLIGYLYLSGQQDRIEEIFEIARKLVLSAKEGDNNEG
ncbi:MAG: ribonuclease III domain-containing protein [Thermincola sp.]|jgi:ribonuclease-3 family protein|nr:ribonuclease III domain-containing protein [Thermincola sp.]MDT3704881.1 ribonuclease III domain-containing protein [Thermincola sp.]